MPTTGLGKWRYPNPSDEPDVPLRIQQLAEDGERNTIIVDDAARAALVTNSYAFDGMTLPQADGNELWFYDGANWHPGGITKWSMRRAATQSLANATWATIDFDSAVISTLTGFSESAGTITCSKAGTYKVEYRTQFASNATGNRGVKIRKNATDQSSMLGPTGAGSEPAAMHDFAIVTLAASDTIDIQAFQSSTAALNVTQALVFITRID